MVFQISVVLIIVVINDSHINIAPMVKIGMGLKLNLFISTLRFDNNADENDTFEIT